jgi:hypothetical protein
MDEMTTTPETMPAAGRRGRRARRSARNAPPAQSGGAVYGLGMIGALVYFAGRSESPQDYLLAFGKAMVWPAILVYRAFQRLDD